MTILIGSDIFITRRDKYITSYEEDTTMKKANTKSKIILIISIGIFCILSLLAAIWYANTYNGGRLVTPTDFTSYRFQAGDIPIIAASVLISVYALWLMLLLFHSVLHNLIVQNKNSQTAVKTRKLNPMLGLLGFLGFLGCVGFWTYQTDKVIFPFCFFVFFGFFGFFYEGKMSGTFMDERFRENAQRAQLNALKVGYVIIFVLMLIVGRGRYTGNLEYTAIVLVTVISLTLGLVMFLSEYLLYRYDHDDMYEE